MRASIFAEENRKWLTLASVSFGLFMIMLDNTVVNVALPSIQRDLGADLSELEWIVTGYALTFASLMLVGGKVADAYGRRLVFVLGIVVFTVASLGCGLAGSSEMLIGARVLQGAGAALMNPATLSIIAATFPPRERGTAIGIWAGTSAMALAIGPLVGGLITEHLHWSWIFFVNIPIGVLGIAASYLFIDESRDETHASLDLPGLATSAVGLFSLTYGLIEANTYGWTSPRIVGAFLLAAIALSSFLVIERRRRAPMLPLDLFRNGTYTGANLVVLLVALAMFGVFFFVSLYLQNILGYSPVETGAAFLPMTLLIILVAPIAGKTSDRIGSRGLMTAGMILVAIHLVLFSRLGVDATFWDLLPALVVGGVGMALTMPTGAAAVTRSVPVDKAGVGSAVLNSARQVGGTMGIAIMGAIMAAELGDVPSVEAFMRGFERALLVAAGIAVVGAVVAWSLVRPHEEARRTGRATAEPVAK
jgi:EmrB/QacA subfamily drug resistance transporter